MSFPDHDFEEERRVMVENQLRARGVADERVLRAMQEVPRELFVPEIYREHSYDDGALSIGEGQTISQPFMVARTCELAQIAPMHRVLEVGAGSGYQAAVLSHLASEVVAIERIPLLAERARETLREAGIENVDVIVGDGSQGYAPRAPYDRILVAAGARDVPPALVQQLASEGRLVIPVGTRWVQELRTVVKSPEGIYEVSCEPCTFVPLVGEGGWPEPEPKPSAEREHLA